MKKILLSLILVNSIHMGYADTNSDTTNSDCHPSIDKTQANYLLGYGSLMNEASRSSTNPDVKVLIPVKIDGFTREWNAASSDYHIIYVGARECKKDEKECFLNGLAYLTSGIDATDKRESIYCRKEVPFSKIKTYTKQTKLDPKAKYWIYTTEPQYSKQPSEQYPIMQSYVDLFIGGCVEQAASITNKPIDKLNFPDDYGFVFDCISGTKGWTTDYWLNDRVYPQRPWAMSPYALKIDNVLSQSYQSGAIEGNYAYRDIPLA